MVDALDLGSSEIFSWGFESPLSHQITTHWSENWQRMNRAERKFTVKVDSPSECKRVLSIEIDGQELEREKETVKRELRRDLNVPGFRKGKVPEKYIEKNYARVIHGDAVRNLLPHVYEDALVREGIHPVGEPSFENLKAEEGENVTVDVTVEVRPNVEIKGYAGLKLKVERREIDDAAVDHALEHLQERMMSYRVVDREVREDDLVLIDYAPLKHDGEVDGAKMSRNHPVEVSSGSLLPEFREALPGMRTGEDKDVRVSYPDDFPDKDNAGTEKTFRVTVKEIKVKVLPEIDDEFAKKVGENFTDLESLRRQVKEDLIKDEEKRYEHEMEEKIIDELIGKNPFDVPDAMVNNYLASVLEEDKRRRPHVADEAEREREIREHFHDAAVRTITKYFVLEAVKKQEGIEVDGEEVDGHIDELAGGNAEKEDEIRSYFRHPERRRSLENELLDRKILKFLRDGADVKAA